MEKPKNKVFHGSEKGLDGGIAVPSRQIRTTEIDGVEKVIFDEESFHATKYKWIALAYTYTPKEVELNPGQKVAYSMAVSLYGEETKKVLVFGLNSLEETLDVLYGNGGYLYHFDENEFIYKEGLGDLEVVSNDPVYPIEVETISDPVNEMRKLGVEFEFVDLALQEKETD